jgi:hypothetical protein
MPTSKIWAVVKANAYGHGLASALKGFADAVLGVLRDHPDRPLRKYPVLSTFPFDMGFRHIEPGNVSKWKEYQDIILETFDKDRIAYNEHSTPGGKHTPLLVSINEVVEDKKLMWEMIDNCWIQSQWSASITPKPVHCKPGSMPKIRTVLMAIPLASCGTKSLERAMPSRASGHTFHSIWVAATSLPIGRTPKHSVEPLDDGSNVAQRLQHQRRPLPIPHC